MIVFVGVFIFALVQFMTAAILALRGELFASFVMLCSGALNNILLKILADEALKEDE